VWPRDLGIPSSSRARGREVTVPGPGNTPYVVYSQLGQYLPQAVLNLATEAQQIQACADATDMADAYMNGRYAMPLLSWDNSVTRNTAAIAVYLLMDGVIGWGAMAGSDRNIRASYARALGGPDPDNASFVHPGFFPGVQRQNLHPNVTPSLPVGQDPVHDAPQVSSNQPRGWQQFRNGRPVIGG
jgi:hypothetical protein